MNATFHSGRLLEVSARRVPQRSADRADAGHDCVHVQQRELLGASDKAVMAAAVAESRVLVSMDTDFGELLAGSNASLPSLVLFRRVGRTADEQAAVLLLNLADIADDLEVGAITVITNTEIRLRRLPLHPTAPA